MDHLCDTDGCGNPAHCIPASAHKQNTDRINCRGIGLHHIGDVITGVMPCIHAVKDESGSVDVMSGCRRVFLIPAPDAYHVRPELGDDLDSAVVSAVDKKMRKRQRSSGSSEA